MRQQHLKFVRQQQLSTTTAFVTVVPPVAPLPLPPAHLCHLARISMQRITGRVPTAISTLCRRRVDEALVQHFVHDLWV